jgi:hypothetical protein
VTAYRGDREALVARIERGRSELASIEQRVRVPAALDIAYASRPDVAAQWKTTRDATIRALSEGDLRTKPEDDVLTLADQLESVVAQWQTLERDAEGLTTLVTTAGQVPLPARTWGVGIGKLNVPVDVSGELFGEASGFAERVKKMLGAVGCEDVQLDWEEPPGWLTMPWVLRGQGRRGNDPIAMLFEIGNQMGALIPTVSLTTSVAPAATPMLVLSRGQWAKRLFADRRRLGIEQHTGDDEIDGLFALRHPGELADLPNFIAHLRALAPAERLHVEVSAGCALVRWTYEAEPALLRASLELLRALRAAPVRFSLGNEP